jgi:hypothetical protein
MVFGLIRPLDAHDFAPEVQDIYNARPNAWIGGELPKRIEDCAPLGWRARHSRRELWQLGFVTGHSGRGDRWAGKKAAPQRSFLSRFTALSQGRVGE